MLRSLLLILVLLNACAFSQTVPVVMLSDLHFDPLRDPGKAARLAEAPASEWSAILREPATATQSADFAAIQAKCGSRLGIDSDFGLMTRSLSAAAAQSAHTRFVTVSGDLLVHQFECRWRMAMHKEEGYNSFAEKTSSFVIGQVEAAFPGTPVYVALGNNDTSCGDYRMDPHDRYLKATSAAVLHGLVGASTREREEALSSYELTGNFSVPLPGLKATRLIVLDDIFFSRKYSTCAGKQDSAPSAAVLQWLNSQLLDAQQHGESVWLIAHIPPGVDVYSTVTRLRDVCGGVAPEMFLQGSGLAETISRYRNTVRLAIFGHTHDDELRLLGDVPAKLVGSITPVNGNLPSFTVAQVNPATAELEDYDVYVAADKTGAGPWAHEYRFRETFGGESFSGANLQRIVRSFTADPESKTDASKAYERDFFPGFASPLSLVWPQAACALKNLTPESYRNCTCSSVPKP